MLNYAILRVSGILIFPESGAMRRVNWRVGQYKRQDGVKDWRHVGGRGLRTRPGWSPESRSRTSSARQTRSATPQRLLFGGVPLVGPARKPVKMLLLLAAVAGESAHAKPFYPVRSPDCEMFVGGRRPVSAICTQERGRRIAPCIIYR